MKDAKFYDGMWRVDIGDTHFCSQTFEGLQMAVRTRYPFSVHIEPERPVELKGAAKHLDTIRNGRTIEEKQDARRNLMATHAHLFARPLSVQADMLSKRLNKPFDDLTVAEMTQFVNDVVLRNKLLNELFDRHTLRD